MGNERKWTEAQEYAMNLRDKLILVSAAAGSGKTSVLTERIIRTLTQRENPADLSRMLVVTFTRAATAELKSRIAAALTNALAERPGDPHLSKQLFLLGSAQISTIDAFFQQAVRANFEQIGLPAAFRLADEHEANGIALSAMNDAVHDMYERYAPQKKSEAIGALQALSENPFARAMNHLMNNRGNGGLDEKLLELERKFHSYSKGIDLLADYAKNFRAAAQSELLESEISKPLLRYLTDAIGDLIEALQPAMHYLAADPDANEKYSGVLHYDLDYCMALRDALASRSYERVRSVALGYTPAKFPGYRNKPLPMLEYKSVRDRVKELANDLKNTFFVHSKTEVSAQLLETAQLCEMLHSLFQNYRARVWDEKKQKGVLEFDDVREQFYRLLVTENGAPSPIAEAMSRQYDTIYIDEYQDVDGLQDQIFQLIGGSRRFMVGDIKQSIYGFRGSDPLIFTAYRNAMPQHDQPEAEDSEAVCVFMSENFRCNQPVIRFANEICGFLFSACEESVGYRPQDDLVFSKGRSEELPPASAVQTVIFEELPSRRGAMEEDEDEMPKDCREARWVAAEISRLIREEQLDNGDPIRPSHVAILVRNAKHGEPFAAELEKLGIPVSSPGGEDILHEPIATDTVNLLRAIDNPHRDLPLSEYLLSPLGGFTLEELSQIRAAAPQNKTLFDAMTAVGENGEHPLAPKVKRLLTWLEAQRRFASTLPADRYLRLLYSEPLLAPYATTPELLTLYEQARSYQKTAWNGLYGFLEQLDRMIDGKPISAKGFRKAQDTVSIMTIHHSKGLEYPVVFVCACDKRPSDQSVKNHLIFHPKVGCTSKLFWEDTASNRTTLLREIAKLEVRADEAEEAIRVLYVALTRARERLYVTGTPRGNLESAMESAANVKRGSRENILYHCNYLRWILAALQENHRSTADFPCIFRKILLSDVIDGIPIDVSAPHEKEEKLPRVPSQMERYQSILREKERFAYPLDALRGLPTKVAASKLHPDLLDTVWMEDEDPEALNRQIDLMSAATPSFERLLGSRETASAAEIGTATHSFLQYCDLRALPRVGLDAEIARMVEQRFITEETAKLLDRTQLEAFLRSNLTEMVGRAKKIYREQTFNLFIPLSALTEKHKKEEIYQKQSVFVQGSVDLILEMTDGRLVLVDYKTDRITPEEASNEVLLASRMAKKHSDQLSCYAGAVKQLFGKEPDEVYLYSLPLGKALLLPTDSNRFN
ncbi:MAG: hypothetical protein E7620_06555 [Ruminococcaceae bacterium]|nr:hypothetical protein [Oscillospiraceae bacterium]